VSFTPLNHVALLVPSVKKSAAVLAAYRFPIGPAEEWEGEGTLEVYVGDQSAKSGLLLLMEPVKEGAYARAMQKRGPGLHHLAVDVLDLGGFIDGLSGSGWLLHPKSLKTIKDTQTAYLARPGTPMLIEVQEREAPANKPGFVQNIGMPLSARDARMLGALGLGQVLPSSSGDLWIQMDGIRVDFRDLLHII
jgi:methylmalonyl-CoA/ethylmalonyl-CoA epimerase